MLKHYVFAVITLAIIPTLTSCRQEVHASSEQIAVPVQVRTPALVERAEAVSASGSVEGSETADVAFLVAGKVARVRVEEGQHVIKGQLLAEIEPTDYRNAFNEAIGQKDAAQAIAQKADAGLRKQELEQARIDFERAEDEYSACGYCWSGRACHRTISKNTRRHTRLLASGMKWRRKGPERKIVPRPKPRRTRRRPRPVKNENGWQTRRSWPRSREHIDAQGRSGQTVAAGTSVFSIVDLNPAKVRVGVPEADIAKVKLGARATVTLPSLAGRQFEGKVGIIGVAAEAASRTYTVKIIVPNPGPVLLAGMVAEAQILGHATVDALTIPGEAIVHDPQGAPSVFVYFPDRKRVYAHNIEVGPPIGTEVEIRSGLRGAEKVVVAGQQKLRDGMLVEIAGGAQ